MDSSLGRILNGEETFNSQGTTTVRISAAARMAMFRYRFTEARAATAFTPSMGSTNAFRSVIFANIQNTTSPVSAYFEVAQVYREEYTYTNRDMEKTADA